MLDQLIQQGENEELEFKSSFGREAIESLVAFANAKGGRVLIGVKGTGEVAGASISAESPQQWINQVKAATSPSVVPDVEVVQIPSIFKEAGIIEKYGSGIKRVQQVMHTAGAKEPLFEIVGTFFKVTLCPINEGVNEGVKVLHRLINENKGKRVPFFAKELKTSEKNIERWLKQLKEKGKIEFRGASKKGGYFPAGDDADSR